MDGFRQTWLPLSDRLYRLAFHLLEDAAEAEDAVQDLYVRLWSKRSTLTEVRSPEAFALTMMRNLCLDRLRARKNHPEPLPEGLSMADGTPGPERLAVDREAVRRMQAAMAALPQRQRTVLRLRVLEGLEYEEIARQTGLSQIPLRVLLSQARKTLKSSYEKD